MQQLQNELTHADLQFLRGALKVAININTEQLKFCKERSGFYWSLADKNDSEETQEFFNAHSRFRKSAIRSKTNLRKLEDIQRKIRKSLSYSHTQPVIADFEFFAFIRPDTYPDVHDV